MPMSRRVPVPTRRRLRSAAFRLAVLLSLAAGCAAPPPRQAAPPARPAPEDLIVLLPGQDGKDGRRLGDARLRATHPRRALCHRADQSRRRAPDGRHHRGGGADASGAMPSPLQPPRPVSFLLYFLEAKDELTPESERVIQQIFAEIGRRPAPEIAVIGHTDRVGSVQSNDALSLRRAQKIRDDMVKLGVPADQIQVAGRESASRSWPPRTRSPSRGIAASRSACAERPAHGPFHRRMSRARSSAASTPAAKRSTSRRTASPTASGPASGGVSASTRLEPRAPVELARRVGGVGHPIGHQTEDLPSAHPVARGLVGKLVDDAERRPAARGESAGRPTGEQKVRGVVAGIAVLDLAGRRVDDALPRR